MGQIVDINGEPYTSAGEDLDLEKVKSGLRQALHQEIQRALLTAVDGELSIDARDLFSYFEIAYALGRAREGDSRCPTQVERRRIEQIIEEALDILGSQVWDATTVHRGDLQLGPVLKRIDQAYYAGREDGAA